MAAISGMRIKDLSEDKCAVSVKFKWLNQNPFRSTFWAVLGMTAEMSTGALLLCYSKASSPPFRFILVGNSSTFSKKAKGISRFTCLDGEKIRTTLQKMNASNPDTSIILESNGYNEEGEKIATFTFTWKLKLIEK